MTIVDIAGVVAVLVLVVITIVVTALKGKYGLVAVGLLIHLCWWIGALRLAKPGSYWARRFYDLDRLRAQARFPRHRQKHVNDTP